MKEPIKGIFDKQHPDPRSKLLQERIHIIGLVNEKKYYNKLIEKIIFFGNPAFFKDVDEVRNALLFSCKNLKYCFKIIN